VKAVGGEASRREAGTAALADLFAQHAARLAVALTAAGYADAADAVQEAFVQAVVHWRKVAHYDDPLAWIRRVAINRARNRRRGRTRQSALAERIAQQTVAQIGATEPDAVCAVDEEMVDAIAALPERQRLALVLVYFADLSVAETADAMEISAGAVRYHLHAARTALGRTLEVPHGMG